MNTKYLLCGGNLIKLKRKVRHFSDFGVFYMRVCPVLKSAED